MKFPRRRLVAGAGAGLALAAVAPATVFYHHKKLAAQAEEGIEADEPEIVLPNFLSAQLANRLIGIWDIRFSHGHEKPSTLPRGDLQLLLDLAPGGETLHGFLGCLAFPNNFLHATGRLDFLQFPNFHLRISNGVDTTFEIEAIHDEIWGNWSTGGGKATLSGSLLSAGRQKGFSTAKTSFVAIRRPFVEAKQLITYVPALEEWLTSPGHRLYHQLWHASRDRWHRLDEERRQLLRGLGWQAGPLGAERDARGRYRRQNGSGEDFLFMHRQMLHRARTMQSFPSWTYLPTPRPFIEHGVQAFADYMSNIDGTSVPPAWEVSGDNQFNKWLLYIKSSEGYYRDFHYWETLYRDPEYLATLSLGEFGSRMELGAHDWLHMRWASLPRNPNTGFPIPYGRGPIDFSERWFDPQNHFLGDPFSSHVDPLFWGFHGWIDDRLEDWFQAHESVHPGQVIRKEVNGQPWYAPGPWVRVAEPWIGPNEIGCGAWGRRNRNETGELDIETMILALRIVFAEELELNRIKDRAAQRPWYGRHVARSLSDFRPL